jgi:hypothetical protein
LRHAFALLFLIGTLALPGCKSAEAPRTQSEERPRAKDDALWWELQGDKELARGNDSDDDVFRRQQYTWAIRDFGRARDLYYDELFAAQRAAGSQPLAVGRQEALDIEIDRLSRQIEALYKERPFPIVKPKPLGEILTPDFPRY